MTLHDDTGAKVMIAFGEYLTLIGRNTQSAVATSTVGSGAGMHLVADETSVEEVSGELLDQFCRSFPGYCDSDPFEVLRRFDQVWGHLATVATDLSKFLLEVFPLPPDEVTIRVRPADVRQLLSLMDTVAPSLRVSAAMSGVGERVATALDCAKPSGG